MAAAEQTVNKRAYSIGEVTEMISVSKSFVRKEIDAGNLVARRFGRRVVIFAADFEAYLSNAEISVAEVVA